MLTLKNFRIGTLSVYFLSHHTLGEKKHIETAGIEPMSSYSASSYSGSLDYGSSGLIELKFVLFRKSLCGNEEAKLFLKFVKRWQKKNWKGVVHSTESFSKIRKLHFSPTSAQNQTRKASG